MSLCQMIISFYVKPFYRAETPKLDRELCVAAHSFVEESLTMITKTDRDWLTSLQVKRRARCDGERSKWGAQ